ncbi:MAG TPA: hypothetical protein VGL22_00285 [Terracidiphilus sp.]|jgi:hypothetical protein
MINARRSVAFYNTLAILALVVILAFIRYFYPNASGTLWNLVVCVALAWACGVAVLGVVQVVRSRRP